MITQVSLLGKEGHHYSGIIFLEGKVSLLNFEKTSMTTEVSQLGKQVRTLVKYHYSSVNQTRACRN